MFGSWRRWCLWSWGMMAYLNQIIRYQIALLAHLSCGIPLLSRRLSSTLGKLLCELSRSAECMEEVPLFWMGLSDCHVVKPKEDKAVGHILFKPTDLHLHFQRGMAEVWYGHVQKLWESSSVPVWIFSSCPKTNYIQQPVCSPYGCGLLS